MVGGHRTLIMMEGNTMIIIDQEVAISPSVVKDPMET